MNEVEHGFVLLILLVGSVVVVAMLIKASFERLGLPALIGYLLLGLVLGWADEWTGLMTPLTTAGFEFLARVGLVALLFRVGMESDLASLTRQLPRASLGWIGSVVPSGVLGYLAAHWMGYSTVPALCAGIALTATSIGVTVAVWQEADALHSDEGALLLDVAELDDISGIVLMAAFLAIVPVLHDNPNAVLVTLSQVGLSLFLKLTLLAVGCFIFARYVERHVTAWFTRLEPEPAPMVLVTGIGLVIAAFAGWLGFTLAIGAFFAGLAFSRDPERFQIDQAFPALSDFFGPFFFVGIGLAIDPGSLGAAVGLGLALFTVGAVGKIVGTGAAIVAGVGGASALLIGVSMVPRAEIAMVIMQQGRGLGPEVVPDALFGAMVLMSLVSCIATPLAVRYLLRRRPVTPGASS